MTRHSVFESGKMALDTLRENKLRSTLTILGVAVGVVTILAMVSIIQGLNKAFAEQLESLGSNTIFVSKFSPSFGKPPGPEERQRKELNVGDADAIRAEVSTAAGVAPFQRELAVTMRYRERQSDTVILVGATPDYEFTLSQYVDVGRFIIDSDLSERTNFVVIGRDVVKSLFPDGEDPMGAEIKIDGNPFKVVGIMSVLGSFFGQSRDNIAFIPLTTIQKYYPRVDPPQSVFVVIVRPNSRAEVKATIEQITDVLRRRRGDRTGDKDSFGISSQDALLDVYNQLTGATYLVLTAISAVALMIGGIGVMNIMLVSVTERTKEIGIRKAVGANSSGILAQFLIEAVVLTAIGGSIGVAVGEVLSLLINAYSPLPAYIPAWAIGLGLLVSAGIGVVFGVFPAWKASNLDPIEALRFE
ncbi:MAG: ABC transporter permease [Acidobacteria bacterium]|nr:ABC transporter permease [Acidobacteriota bacterium]MCW5950555.1 ABC transporter permease [Pyrinomonadaceae bacterium]